MSFKVIKFGDGTYGIMNATNGHHVTHANDALSAFDLQTFSSVSFTKAQVITKLAELRKLESAMSWTPLTQQELEKLHEPEAAPVKKTVKKEETND